MENSILKIDAIRIDGGTQPRATIDFAAVDDYMDAMADGAKFPPVVVFYDGVNYWLADGFHRIKAADQAGHTEIACEVHQGTQTDAQWYSFAANKTNGLRRTNDDKQRAVKAALKHPMGAGKSNSAIARHVGVDESSVRGWREKLVAASQIPKIDTRTVTRNGRTYQQNIVGIGRKRKKDEATPQPNPSIPESEKHQAKFVSEVPPTGNIPPSATALQFAVPPPSPASPPPSDVEDHAAGEWIARFHCACIEIAGCQLTAKDLAASIRRSDESDQLKKQLEKIRDFINTILAGADIA